MLRRAVAFRHNRIKKQEVLCKKHSASFVCLFCLKLNTVLFLSRSKTYGFLHFYCFLFYFRFLSPPYVYTPLGRRTKISALNPFAPRFSLIKNSLFMYFLLWFSRFCIDFIEFLMRQPHSITCHFEQKTAENKPF